MVEAVSSIVVDVVALKLGSPDDPGRTLDQLYDWREDYSGVPYWNRGARTFEKYLQVAFWDQTNSGTGTGYRDPGWLRDMTPPTPEDTLDAKGREHRCANHNLRVPHDCELMGISVGDLRRYLGLEFRTRPFLTCS